MGGLTRIAGLAFLASTACRSVVITAANVDAPVLVGPVRPPPRSKHEVRRPSPVKAEVVSVFASGGGSTASGYHENTSSSYQDSEAALDAVLLPKMGDCYGCWIEIRRLAFSSWATITFIGYMSMVADVEADVFHVIGTEP